MIVWKIVLCGWFPLIFIVCYFRLIITIITATTLVLWTVTPTGRLQSARAVASCEFLAHLLDHLVSNYVSKIILKAQFNNNHNAPRSQRPNKNVFNCRLNCSKLMSVCLRWAVPLRLFHSLRPAAAKHLSPQLLQVLQTTHVLELAERSWRRPSSETSWQSAAK